MPAKLRTAAVALAVPMVMFAACGDDGGDRPTGSSDPQGQTSASESTTSSPTDPTTGSSSAEPDALTPPGTVLDVGDTATVPYDDDGVLAVTLISVESAPAGQVRGEITAEEAGWNVRVRAEIVSETANGDIQLISANENLLLLAGGEMAGNLPYTGQETCKYPFEPAKPGPGDSWESCRPFKLSKAQEPDELHYAEFGSPYDFIDGKPVTWRLSR